MAERPLSERPGTIPLRERRTVADEWREYVRRVMPPTAGEEQRTETRRAFYAGAHALSQLQMHGFDAGEQETDLDVAYLESLHQELQQFARDVREGKA